MAKMVDWWFPVKHDFLHSSAARILARSDDGARAMLIMIYLIDETRATGGVLGEMVGEVFDAWEPVTLTQRMPFTAAQLDGAVATLKKLGMLAAGEDGTLYIPDFDELMRTRSKHAQDVANWREKQAESQSESQSESHMNPQVTQESELEQKSRLRVRCESKNQSSVSQSVVDAMAKIGILEAEARTLADGFTEAEAMRLIAYGETSRTPAAYTRRTFTNRREELEQAGNFPMKASAAASTAARSVNPALDYPQRSYRDDYSDLEVFDPDKDYGGIIVDLDADPDGQTD